MPIVSLTTEIAAPIEEVFDLSRSMDLHVKSTSHTSEEIVAGRMTGLIELGDTVTFAATHFFIRQQLEVRITQFDRPNFFQDQMIDGAFSKLTHDHHFETCNAGTTMTDTFNFQSPLGPIGHVVNWAFLTRYVRQLLTRRNQIIKSIAGTPEAAVYLSHDQTAG